MSADRAPQRWKPTPRREPRPGEDEEQPGDRPRARLLAEQCDAERDGDDRVDIGDDHRPARSGLADEHGDDHEPGGGAHEPEDDDGCDRARRGDAGRQVKQRARQQHDRCDREHSAHCGPGIERPEPELDDHRPDRVPDRRDQDRRCPEQLARPPGDVDPDERHDAAEADEQAERPQPGRPLAVVEAEGENRADQGHRGDDDRRQ